MLSNFQTEHVHVDDLDDDIAKQPILALSSQRLPSLQRKLGIDRKSMQHRSIIKQYAPLMSILLSGIVRTVRNNLSGVCRPLLSEDIPCHNVACNTVLLTLCCLIK